VKLTDLKLLVDCANAGKAIIVRPGLFSARLRLLRYGLIEANPMWGDEVRITTKGVAYVDALLAVPIPS